MRMALYFPYRKLDAFHRFGADLEQVCFLTGVSYPVMEIPVFLIRC